MEKFFQSHSFMLNHLNAPVQRSLMDKIDWSHRMIGIRGPRGVGKTTFLLQYARDHFDPQFKQCLYISMNNLLPGARHRGVCRRLREVRRPGAAD